MKAAIALLNTVAAVGCMIVNGPQISRLQARPGPAAAELAPGEHPLGLGGRRDGTLYSTKLDIFAAVDTTGVACMQQPAPL